ncbi:DUF308 domain-containing protein [Corynebacterium heidelbergense]|uniref:DUF308 domain-containing protein n=1 Tax=Corynebacterium heidelbergense TaxID=2055947 RepID=UPI001EE6FA4B|nr:DUF308 domain-containing protein [Corynebacterium heidelbergense]
MGSNNYSDLSGSSAPRRAEPVAVQPRRVTGLSLAALILGILALPCGLLPVLGIIAAIIAIAVGIVALIVASRKQAPRAYAATGLVLGILAMIVGNVSTTMVSRAVDQCQGKEGDALTQCINEIGSK